MYPNADSIMKCIVFDFDGVIAETDTARIKLLSEVLTSNGIDSSKIKIDEISGLSTATYLKKYYPELSENLIIKIISQRQKMFFSELEKYLKPFPDAKDVILQLAEKYELQLATTNTYSNARRMLEFLGLFDCFTHLYGRELVEDKHGFKDYKLIVDKLGYRIDNTIVIEDSFVGIDSAKDAGFFCIKFNPKNKETICDKADVTVNSYKELKRFIDGL